MPSTHEIVTLRPLYGPQSEYVAVCICGDESDPQPTPGAATSAGWAHIREKTAEEKVS